jgi:hypothetical protein
MNRSLHPHGKQIQAVARGELKVTTMQRQNQPDPHCRLELLGTLDSKQSMNSMHETMTKLHSNPAILLW